ncbi:hypothetical protein [Leifsonia sp. fls2-241-R2A-40a]|uniref:hypothetical protein n=1 Tax=Leifsonia sp. fls2-241-R2A-40a TaxID=3040290 RepID=UPI00254D27D9|nr:hypothetical protein [Leifsonia sp. fls2-241-R2A-40a]
MPLLLLGCVENLDRAPVPGAANVRLHEQVRAEVDRLSDAARQAMGSTWTVEEREWTLCRGRFGTVERESLSVSTQSRGVTDPPATVADRVAAAWLALGYATKVVDELGYSRPTKVVSFPAYLTGTDPDGFLVSFTVNDAVATFSGASRCVQTAAERRIGDGLVP